MVSESWMLHSNRRTELVLILVLVEDGLGVYEGRAWIDIDAKSLNPCFSGRWSRSYELNSRFYIEEWVLILVLVEDGLGEARMPSTL